MRVAPPPAMLDWFYTGWEGPVRILVVGVLAYPTLITLLRLSGKRTLSKMNGFDLIITIAFGSVFAALLLNANVSLLNGIVAFATLIGLQYAVAWLGAHYLPFAGVLKGTPTIVLWNGDILHDVCRRERVNPSEVRCAVRTSGYGDLENIQAVILETTGDFAVLAKPNLDKTGDLPVNAFSALGDPTNAPTKNAGDD